MSRFSFVVLMIGLSTGAAAEVREFPLFSIDVPSTWDFEIDADSDMEFLSIYHPGSIGVLKITSYEAPYSISQERLRNLTNVKSSTVLAWGEFSGYQYSESEHGSFFKQWWLESDRTILLIRYESSDIELPDEVETIEEILNSIKLIHS
jgi:hypothetical protein